MFSTKQIVILEAVYLVYVSSYYVFVLLVLHIECNIHIVFVNLGKDLLLFDFYLKKNAISIWAFRVLIISIFYTVFIIFW